MSTETFSHNKTIPVLLLILIIVTGIFIFKTYYIVARDYMKLGADTPVFTEISLDEYQNAMFEGIVRARAMTTDHKETVLANAVTIEDIQEILTVPQCCAVEICKTTEANSISFTYHAAAIAKKKRK